MEIKVIVKTAIRMLGEAGHSHAEGGVWQQSDGLRVEFSKPTRYCAKVAYRLIGNDVGVWTGFLGGKDHSRIGKPTQVYSGEQLAREVELSKRPLDEIVATGLRT